MVGCKMRGFTMAEARFRINFEEKWQHFLGTKNGNMKKMKHLFYRLNWPSFRQARIANPYITRKMRISAFHNLLGFSAEIGYLVS
jgi:hypothetical protein